MKAMKKITSLLIVLLMLLSMAACGGNNGGTVNNPDNPDEIVPNILKARSGDIILMHDLKSSSVEAALEAIDILQAQGYEFVTISELSEINDCPLYGGDVYYDMHI